MRIFSEPSLCCRIVFLLIMTYNKKNTHHNEWKNNQHDDKRCNKVPQKTAKLLPNGEPGFKRISGEQTEKKNSQNTQNPW